MNIVNVAELLKDCPKGMELDCTIWDNVVFDHVDMTSNYPIHIKLIEGREESLTKDGHFTCELGAKCVIFPKGKTTWEGFIPPCKFKDGDIITTNRGNICIYKSPMYYNKNLIDFYCGYIITDSVFVLKQFKDKHFGFINKCRLATEEEKQTLFDAIKEHGYKWNAETKTLERLIKPKFNPNTLNAFDKVICRDSIYVAWTCGFFSHSNIKFSISFKVGGCLYKWCIPYNDETKHLVGTTEEAPEYYRYWED